MAGSTPTACGRSPAACVRAPGYGWPAPARSQAIEPVEQPNNKVKSALEQLRKAYARYPELVDLKENITVVESIIRTRTQGT